MSQNVDVERALDQMIRSVEEGSARNHTCIVYKQCDLEKKLNLQ